MIYKVKVLNSTQQQREKCFEATCKTGITFETNNMLLIDQKNQGKRNREPATRMAAFNKQQPDGAFHLTANDKQDSFVSQFIVHRST
jgi:hypothetical protein